jgi:endogenous inhibitor of DNA gyrase (YacG/DUF329 family)
MSMYKCPACKKTMERSSTQPTHHSFCVTEGKMVTMKKVLPPKKKVKK